MRKLIYTAAAAGLLVLGGLLGRQWAVAHLPVQAREALPPGGLRGYGKVVELIPPPGLDLDPAAVIESRTDGTGTLFVAATTRSGETVVWMQIPTGETRWRSERIDLGQRFAGGRGSLNVEWDSNLYLTLWGNNSRAYRVRVPGWASGDTPK
jgi:hypothetical protein